MAVDSVPLVRPDWVLQITQAVNRFATSLPPSGTSSFTVDAFVSTLPPPASELERRFIGDLRDALESMAARLATLNASDEDIAKLRHLFDEFQNSPPAEHLDEYSDANIAFHTAVIALHSSTPAARMNVRRLTSIRRPIGSAATDNISANVTPCSRLT